MSAEDAKEYGVIDKVLESRKDLPKALPVSVWSIVDSVDRAKLSANY